MNCPRCAYGTLSENAAYCPRCGATLPGAGAQPAVRVRQEVEHNLGNVIGVQTGAIHGDVYGGDIYQVQVYALSGAGRTQDWRAFLDENTAPYRFLAPYMARERALFCGRDDQSREVVRQICERRATVVYGRTGVGKTSLLAAGVIPELMRRGALVVHVRDYVQPLGETVRRALAASTDQIPLSLPGEPTLPGQPTLPGEPGLADLVRAVCEAAQGTLVLVLDQFERLYEPPFNEDRRAVLIESLGRAMEAVDPELFRLVVVVNVLERLSALRDHLPEGLRFPFELLPLGPRQAQAAIETPLAVLGYPGGASYVGDLVSGQLVPHLDALTPDQEGWIQPTHLQIVCSWLYEEARRRYPPPQAAHINEALYRELKGAEGIMARYLGETLDARLPEHQFLARHVLEAMAYPGLDHWVPAERLPANGASPEQVRQVLDRLAGAGLLERYAVNGHFQYAFASAVVAHQVRLEASPEVQRRYQATQDLERVWAEWLAHEERGLATRTQLGYLAQADVFLSPSAAESLLLLRSAVARDVPVAPWLARLRGEAEGQELVRQLDEPLARQDEAWRALGEGPRLLGLYDEALSERPDPIGPVAWSAAVHPDPAVRRAAALALTALGTTGAGGALDRLRWALRELDGGRRLWRRVAELRGALSDADPEIDGLNAELSPRDRFGVWQWRVRRRIVRDRRRILGLPAGGAIGAGLGLGLLRLIVGALAQSQQASIFFAIYVYWGAILGAAQALGMALAEPLLVRRSLASGETPPIWRAPLHADRLPDVLAVGLGTLFFGAAHVVVAWMNGLRLLRAPLVAPLGFVAGLGLSLALYGLPRVDWRPGGVRRPGAWRWLARLGTAALAFCLSQWIAILAHEAGIGPALGVTVFLGGSFYHGEFSDYLMAWWQVFTSRYARWSDGLALLDAALVGLVLAGGMAIGLLLAARFLKKWRDLLDRTID